MVAPLREQLQEYQEFNIGVKHCCSYYLLLKAVIDDKLKRQIKNQTLCTCGLFLLT